MLLKLVPEGTKIPFVNARKIAYVFSVLMIIASFALYFTKGLNFGIDFKGGYLMEVHTTGPADIGQIRSLTGGLDLGDVSVQEFGEVDQVLIRLETQEDKTLEEVVFLVFDIQKEKFL